MSKVTQARISGVNIPVRKRLFVSLSYIYGIGRTNALDICKALDLNHKTRTEDLSEEDLNRLRKHIDANYKIEGVLRGEIASNIKHLISIGCYRGMRHRKGLPVRGQRTRTNARTRKGRKSSPIAGKKKVAK